MLMSTLFSAMATFTSKSNTSGANHVLEVNVLKPMYPITTVSLDNLCFHDNLPCLLHTYTTLGDRNIQKFHIPDV